MSSTDRAAPRRCCLASRRVPCTGVQGSCSLCSLPPATLHNFEYQDTYASRPANSWKWWNKAPAWGFQNNAGAAFRVSFLEKSLTIHLVRRRAYLNAVERVR